MALEEHYEPRLITVIHACVSIPVYEIEHEGVRLAVYCSTLGGPAAVAIMEEIIAKGAERFVFFGSCGVLDRELAANALIVPTAAYRDEGTSYHYMPPSDYVEVATAWELSRVLSDLNLPHVGGKTWTTDAIYRETRGNVEKRKAEGCIAVEMECASIMAATAFRGIAAYQFLYAADSLDAAEWDARTLGSLPQTALEGFLRVALAVAARVS
jgi:uridine phosphorylase